MNNQCVVHVVVAFDGDNNAFIAGVDDARTPRTHKSRHAYHRPNYHLH
jgi:hypothetical protein